MAEDMEEDYDEKARGRLVALYEFDPSAIDWPFRRQRPLPLEIGQVVQVIHDNGSDWALGHPLGEPENRGYFPRNYMVSVAEYNEMMRDYETTERPAPPPEDAYKEDRGPMGPPETRALPIGPYPAPSPNSSPARGSKKKVLEDPELVYPGIAEYPTLEAQPPIGTTYALNKSKLLREMPAVPEPAPAAPAPPRDVIEAARWEMERELEELQGGDISKLQGGVLSHSRASTPGNYALTRPERDFVRRGVDPEAQAPHLQPPAPLADLARKQVRVAWEEPPAYRTDLRVRATTCRLARNIEPPHTKIALMRASGNGSKWTQMFRPGFNDIVNESFKVGCNACLLSRLYAEDKEAREQFQKLYAQDVKGIFWYELQRRKKHLFYMRMDFIDVMICHPDAWGFPDTSRIVSAKAGEPINPFHGWYAQHSIDPDRELEDVEFLYSLRLRGFPEQTFQALSLGKVPEWVQPYLSLHAEAQPELDPRDDEADTGPAQGKAINIDKNLMMEAGLEESEDLYVRLDELRLAKERTAAPDVLEAKPISYRLKGLSAMRIFLRSRGNPDNMKQTLISPKMVKDMAAQLGIRGEPPRYWYCMFALRYALSPEWEVIIRNDTRWYLHLPSDRLQPVHPMIRRFREHLDDYKSNEFLWDYRGFVKMKCSECGIPDSVIWCHQCTDYFCAPCHLQTHKSKRGKKHWPMPVPGCRYLTGTEAARMGEFLPLLNAGFSNRRRFLARDNQSDKNGSRNGDTWLFFHADTFHAALQQAPEKHWYLKRLKPPRLAPAVEGYYYNFATDVLADDASHILLKQHEQHGLSMLQKNMRGVLTRKAIRQETEAVLVIQKTKMMWDVRAAYGSNGRKTNMLKRWHRKFKARRDMNLIRTRLSKIQALWRGYTTRKDYREMLVKITRSQAAFRGTLARRKMAVLRKAVASIQRLLRGRLYGRRVVQRWHQHAAKVEAMARGVAWRREYHGKIAAATYVQAHFRGMVTRNRVARLHTSGLKIQTNWRRFQGQLAVKQLAYERAGGLRARRQDVIYRKLMTAAATLIQRSFLRHLANEKVAGMRREKGEADKRTSTMLVALYSGASNLRNFVHPWWRHLPKEIQDVLQSIKGPLQRTIAQVPVTGKLANEEMGRRGLRVGTERHLRCEQRGQEPDLASHLLLSVTRHLLSHVPAELFAPTVRWACYAVGHQAVGINRTKGYFPKEEIPVGKELPPHPGDTLSTLYRDLAGVRNRNDRQISLPAESLPCLFLKGLPTHHRHVFLTAEVLVTMRQALDTPSLSTDDHLRFQGVDASAGAQLMEILGSELDHRLPLDWPKLYGTVAALAAQMGTHVHELVQESGGVAAKLDKKDVKAKDKGDGKAKPEVKATKEKPKADAKPEPKKVVSEQEVSEGGMIACFNRAATLRIVQQLGYFMVDQDNIIDAVLKRQETDEDLNTTGVKDKGTGVRQSRYVAVTDRLFDIADREKHDHCSFVLAVVLYHMVLRGLMLRVLYHRAAVALQVRYRYFKTGSTRRQGVAPAICIQRFWRGLSTRLRIMRQDDAAERIQHSYRTWKWNGRAGKLLASTLLVQRIWRGAVCRKWLRRCRSAATLIQKNFRRMLVLVTLNKAGRELMRKQQLELTALLKHKGKMSEGEYTARSAALVAKARVAIAKFRDINVDVRRVGSFSIKSQYARRLDKQKKLRMKGSVQPVRLSVFEPVAFASRRIAQRGGKAPARYGAPQSKVVSVVSRARLELERALPQASADREKEARCHAAARAGHRAVRARRMAKQPKLSAAGPPQRLVDSAGFERWMAVQFGPRR